MNLNKHRAKVKWKIIAVRVKSSQSNSPLARDNDTRIHLKKTSFTHERIISMKSHFLTYFQTNRYISPFGVLNPVIATEVFPPCFLYSLAVSYPSWRVLETQEPSSMTTPAVLGSCWMSTCDSELKNPLGVPPAAKGCLGETRWSSAESSHNNPPSPSLL